MRSILKFFILLALALGSVSSEAARPFAAICRSANWLLGREAPPKPASVDLTREEATAWRAWLALHSSEKHTADLIFDRDLQLVLLSELSPELRRKIFSPGSASVKPHQLEPLVRARLELLGAKIDESKLLENMLQRLTWAGMGRVPGDNGYVVLERELAAAKSVVGEARSKALAEARLLIAVDRAKAILMDDRNPQYELRFDGNQVILPDGKRYDFTRTFSGRLKIFIPYRDLIQHQTYENGGIIGKYFDQLFNGWSGLDGGKLTPDGRYFMADTYHRAKAYALKHVKNGDFESTPVPMLISPSRDGKFYTKTHWSILAGGYQVPNVRNSARWWSDKTWSFLPPADRERILQLAETDPAAAIRDVYYSSTGLSRLH